MYLSHELEAVQKRAMRIIFPSLMYDEALVKTSLVTVRPKASPNGQNVQENLR